MRTVTLERTIRAPAADVFDWLTDATNYQRVPVIRRVMLVRPGDVAEHGVGAVRLLVTPFVRVTEEIVEYDPPRMMRYKLLSSYPTLRYLDGLMTFRDVAHGTRMCWRTEFEVAAPIFGDLWTLAMAPMVVLGIKNVMATAERELRRD
ncbi:SRPBCC family protein [Nocardia sp. NEAU-G5]|uniref:SRPBCC family protein n=1 Tax=Nocardia albiluteola TaxID=2842303 RepID=A0ABS6AV09_9NOCA|nr:SRPBCC family protein [Nocardia albiluteola]MBU3061395.1 SRPBCC family protein [Nocardia albiluteola]